MNKKKVNDEISTAYDVLDICGIARNGSISKTYRGYISTFGAAITMGSLIAAIAFFSDQGGADKDRSKLMDAIYKVLEDAEITSKYKGNKQAKDIFELVKDNKNREAELKEDIINAAIAIKLAMNLYKLT